MSLLRDPHVDALDMELWVSESPIGGSGEGLDGIVGCLPAALTFASRRTSRGASTTATYTSLPSGAAASAMTWPTPGVASRAPPWQTVRPPSSTFPYIHSLLDRRQHRFVPV